MKKVLGPLLMLIVIVSGCVNPVNLYTADKYAQAGYRNLHAGDWVNGSKEFWKSNLECKGGQGR